MERSEADQIDVSAKSADGGGHSVVRHSVSLIQLASVVEVSDRNRMHWQARTPNDDCIDVEAYECFARLCCPIIAHKARISIHDLDADPS